MDRIIEKKKWTTKKIVTITAITAFVLFVIYLVFFRDKQSRLYVNQDEITIATVEKGKFQEFIPVDGIVYPKNTIYIDAVQGGIVEQVYVEDGAMLKKGDPILKLSNADMELNYMDQETRMYDAINNLANTKISLEQNKYNRQKDITSIQYDIDKLKLDFQRKQGFYKQDMISKKEFEDAQRDYEYALKQLNISLRLQRLDSISNITQGSQIASSMDRMHNNLGLLRKNLENLIVKAPADGQLSSFLVEIGQTKGAGEHLGELNIQGGYKLRANVDERYISRVFNGQEAEFDLSGKTYEMQVFKIYSNVTNGSFQVDLKFKNEEPQDIKRGQTLQLRLKFSSPTDALILKRGGFFQETGGNWVYLLDGSGKTAVKHTIRIGRQNTDYYEVLEGLQPGDKVIVSSYDSFGNKDKLILK
ncbi:MAG TPA: HlyD family efflux transporter periplasmic adaptor subunit [Bacteroidales bacterium]|nr:HlyD family efflux transporter periplasmic adaptor subunit [Bacteroidales bacterium]HPT04480.1 HlyD family efflux transporter periplasmic adaptor subunit [Bacteroidales bacterium]